MIVKLENHEVAITKGKKIEVYLGNRRVLSTGTIRKYSGEQSPAIFYLNYAFDTDKFIEKILEIDFDQNKISPIQKNNVELFNYNSELHLNHQYDHHTGWVEELPANERYAI